MPALELMATAIGGPVSDPEPGVTGQVRFAAVQLAERRTSRWVLATAPRTGGFWKAMVDAEARVAEAMRKIDAGEQTDSIPGLRTRLTPLYDSLVSQELDATLEAAAAHKPGEAPPILRLHLAPGLDMIPWELLFKRQFLGLEYQVVRVPMVSGGPRQAGRMRKVARVSTVLGAEVVDDDQRAAWDGTFDGTVNGEVTLFKTPKAADDWPTVGVLPEAFGEIVHITCHGLASSDGERYWSLDKRKPDDMDVSVYPRDGDTQFQLGRFAPLVFANACSSATAAAPAAIATGPRFAALAEGFGSTFYDMGASVFIGTIGPVSKRIALEFAKRFFAKLLGERLPAGEALWFTRRSFADEGEKDPSWLFYCMYGDPEIRFVPGGGHG
jgi:hypothetical protein